MVRDTSWMGKHRTLVDRFIRLFNTYTRQYTTVNPLEGTPFEVSSVQIHTLEYILEGEGQKMSQIAERMGISRSAFSNNINKLVAKGYLEKQKNPNNQKDIYLKVTPLGRELYQAYSEFIYRAWYKKMFALADQMPPESMELLIQILDGFTEAFMGNGKLHERA